MRAKAISIVSTLVLSSTAVIVACSGGDGPVNGSGGNDAVTSLPATKDVASLTPSEQQTFCSDVLAYYKRVVTPEKTKQFGCAIAAQISGGFAAAFKQDPIPQCQKTYDECIAKPVSTSSDTEDAGAIETSTCEIETCTNVTVADYSACVKESVAAFTSLNFSCQAVSFSQDAGTPATSTNLGPACAKVSAACDKGASSGP